MKKNRCPFCGSTNTIKFPFSFNDDTGRVCKSCGGGFHTDRNYSSDDKYKLGQLDWTFSERRKKFKR